MARDESESKLIRELRKQNHRLKTENRRLKKENRRYRNDDTPEDPYEDEHEEMVLAPVETKEEQLSCPKCGAYIKNKFLIMERPYYRCECGSKGPVSKLKPS